MSPRWGDLAIVAGLAVLALGAAVIEPEFPLLRPALGLALVLVLPGYAITAAIFPDRAPEVPQRLLFTVAISLAVTILGGYLLNLTPRGLQTGTWAVLLSSVTVAGGAVALVRRLGYATRTSTGSTAPPVNLGGSRWLLLGLAAVIAAGALWIAQIGATAASTARFTQLWILPGGEPGKYAEVHIGLSNQEGRSVE
jgi:uncharacterized membrane protein